MVKTAEILIDGAWTAANSVARHVIIDPATLASYRAVPECNQSDFAAAAGAARRALSEWSRRSQADRAALLEEAAREIERRASALAEIHARESGQVFCEALDMVHAAAAGVRRSANSPAKTGLSAQVTAVQAAADDALADWAISVSQLLLLGSTAVCLLPIERPLAALAVCECLSVLPPGVINILTADGNTMRLLARQDDCDSVVTVGGASPAYDGASRSPTRLATAGIFVSEDANLELAAAGAASLRFFHSGQRHGLSTRIYVARPIVDAFADRLHEFIAVLEVGDPCKPGTDLGPLTSAAAITQVEEAVGRALRQRARLRLGGRRYQPWGLRGYFFQPTILIDRGEGRLEDDRIAGPVAIITPVPELAAVVRDRDRDGARLLIFLFAQDAATERRSLEQAGFTAHLTSATQIDRCPDTDGNRAARPSGVMIEHVDRSQLSWFPYHQRGLQVPGK